MAYARQRNQCKRALLFRPGWRHSLGCGDLESYYGVPPQAAHYRCGSEVGALRQLLQVPHYLGGVITTWCNPNVCDGESERS